MGIPKRVLGILVWVVVLGGIYPAAQLGNLIAERTEGLLSLILFIGLVVAYIAGVSAVILMLDTAFRKLSARFGWSYEDSSD